MHDELAMEVKRLTKLYDEKVYALNEISLSVHKGEWVAVMGSSGSGKTTFLNIVSGLDRPTSGEVIINGDNIAVLSTDELTRFRRENIGLVFQQFYLIRYLNALENVMLAQYFHSMADEQEALQALNVVGLAGRANHLPSQLSGGEQQRVCIARALINSPSLILADEPTGNLDEANEKVVVELLQKLNKEGHTIVMVTHDPEVAQAADRIVHFEHGKITSERKTGAPVFGS